MDKQAKIVIVEQNIPMAAKLSLQLNKLGYHITGIFSRAKDALTFIEQESPDFILLEDQLKGQLNGLEAKSKKKEQISPVLYFDMNRTDWLQNYLSVRIKSKKQLLKKVISDSLQLPNKNPHQSSPAILKDRIFVRSHDKMVRIALSDIHYIEADRNYCKVYTKSKKFLLVCTLKEVDDKLKDKRFLRIHRSYIVNISHIDEIGSNHVVISSHALPLSKTMRPELFQHLQVI
ncbi:LytTR family DNA-binding domain-containing protein [Christiangramia sp. SM2212]|uniref:LytTR family DNA-binding domain-containing protein n=1 Tax=Christiangramia sediminicola TaxID=3073267 RepID=A0ABU1ENJ8_9FLAO|nr:LytTR family DNA-binding domain-containing protein [Christiangramia sp. SM2212]MDR5589966.1 LytTR family DNA-binding domain-containing protein [Christiangramia sp. SM2212]